MNLSQIQSFFLRAMANGWIGSGTFVDCADAPGYKAFSFHDGDLLLVDRYCSAPDSTASAGTTTIWHKDVPVWVMHYGGWYERSAIECLKLALRETYGSDQFVGGRGPRSFSVGSIAYANEPRLDDFKKFDGREEIRDVSTGTLLGFHEYWGMSLR